MPARPMPLWWEATGRPSGRALVLVPDAHRPASAWPPALIGGLEQAGWRVVRLDLRDQGRSPWVAGTAADGYDLADLAADVAAVATASGGGAPVHLLGHGMGATIALHLGLAARRQGPPISSGSGSRVGPAPVPHLPPISGITTVGGTGWLADPSLPGVEEPVAVGLVWRRRTGEPAASGPGLARALARELRLLSGGDDDPGPAAARAAVERWLAWGCNPADDHRRAWLEAPDRWAALAALAVPLCVIHGARDPVVPAPHGRRLATAVAGARHVEVPGAGHALSRPLVAAVLTELGAGSDAAAGCGTAAGCAVGRADAWAAQGTSDAPDPAVSRRHSSST